MEEQAYLKQRAEVQGAVLQFLRMLEEIQQSINFSQIGSSQQQLQDTTGDTLSRAAAKLDQLTAPDHCQGAHQALKKSLVYLQNALEIFTAKALALNFGASIMSSRDEQCRALEILYRWRTELVVIEPYFRLADDSRSIASLGQNGPNLGVTHHSAAATQNNYSLYVPETYDAARQWPLIVCLHGGHGRGDEYIWSWLRAARSRGYVLLSPKSIAPTWSIVAPSLDVNSIIAMLDRVCESYAIDRSHIYLSGLSDGGTFSYLLGLEHADRFCAVAPIAGVLSPTTDAMLRAKQGRDLPLHVIHGARDMIFPVQTARSTSELLTSLGYNLTYTELPQWGHALTYSINENLVLPWFEQLSSTM